jgi:excisionase family DNA binding protein
MGTAESFVGANACKTADVTGTAGAPALAQHEPPVNVKAAARFLGVSPSLVYAYVERKQIPHYRMMGCSIRFLLSELAEWRKQFRVDGGIT